MCTSTNRIGAVVGSIVLGVCAASGCAYQPDSFSGTRTHFGGQRATVGCLDVAIERRMPRLDGRTVLAYDFGNRCDQPAIVDLASVGVIGRTSQGQLVPLVAFDPRAEIKSSRIDGRAVGSEAIAYWSSVELAGICVDAASITHTTPALWLCL